MLNPASLSSLPTNYLILNSLPTVNIIPLKLPFIGLNAIVSKVKSIMHFPLDLSAAFDTIDHDILITRLSSWFGINGSVFSWFKFCLSSCSFCVKCDNNLFSLQISSCGVPQGSVLSPLLFIVYTTPPSTLISSFSLDYHFYADDTQPTHSTLTQAFLTFRTLFNRHTCTHTHTHTHTRRHTNTQQ